MTYILFYIKGYKSVISNFFLIMFMDMLPA